MFSLACLGEENEKKPVRDVLGERGGEEKGKITGDEYDQSTPYMQIILLNILLCIIDM